MTVDPAVGAGRRSGRAFRAALAEQLNSVLGDAARVAESYGLPASGIGDGRPPSFDGDPERRSTYVGAGSQSAPAYRPGAPTSSNAESWMRFAQAPREEGGLGLTKAQAAGVVANLMHESGPGIAPKGVSGDQGTAHGAAQWRLDRFAALKRKSAEWGLDWGTTEAQQRFMRWELDNSERKAYAALQGAQTPEQAADAFNRLYERSADPGAGRRATARRLFERQAQQQQAALPPGASAGSAGDAVDSMLRLEGLHERRDRATIREYLRTGGAGMDPATTAWCAAVVNSSLQRHGIRGSGSNIANSFQRWGAGVPSEQAQRGDVVIRHRGRGPYQAGGHVGMATGRTRVGSDGTTLIEMVSGNSSNRVERTWERADRVMVRRAPATPKAVASGP